MAKLNLIFVASLLIVASSVRAAPPPQPASGPIAEAPGPLDLESILADAPISSEIFDTLGPKFDDNGPLSTAARAEQELMQVACFKQLISVGGNQDCLLEVVSVLSPTNSHVSGMVELPYKNCCKAFTMLDHQAPECWGFLVRGTVADDRLTRMREVCIAKLDT